MDDRIIYMQVITFLFLSNLDGNFGQVNKHEHETNEILCDHSSK